MFQQGPRYHQAMELLAYDTGDEESDDAWLQVSFLCPEMDLPKK